MLAEAKGQKMAKATLQKGNNAIMFQPFVEAGQRMCRVKYYSIRGGGLAVDVTDIWEARKIYRQHKLNGWR